MTQKKVEKHTLGNGLQLIGEINPANQSAAMGFFVKTGARDETHSEAGISHFLEHMMFKGTKSRSALDVTYALGNIGAQANAFTTEECTAYYGAIVPKYFSEFQELLSDMLRPSLDQAEFDTEKKVILEEIALYLDRPQFFLFEKAMSDFFGSHPAGQSVLGTVETVGAISRQDMLHYFERRYSPSNIILVAAGNFDWNGFVEQAEKHCSAWNNFEAAREVYSHQAQELRREYRKKDISQAHILFVTAGCSAREEERFPLMVLSLILGDSTGSKLYWELVDKGIAESAWCDSDEKDGTGCFSAYATMEPARIDEVAGIVKSVLEKRFDFSEDDLERAKTKLAARVILGSELPMSRLTALGSAWLSRGEIHDLHQVIQNVKTVTRSDIENAVKKYDFDLWSEFRLLPQ